MPDSPFLSIITVSYNSVNTIGDTLESLKAQKCNDFECIVVDGASSDGTKEVVESHRDVISNFISEEDRGIYDAMNKGLAMAKGKYVAFLNSDDAYFDHTVESVKVFAQKSDPQIIYGNLQKERTLGGEILKRIERPDLELMPRTMGIFHPATFVVRELFEKLGDYDLRFRQAADYHWLLRAFTHGVNFKYLDEVLTKFRIGGISNSSCETYREAAIIQEELKTGHHEEMIRLHQKCLKKQKKGEVIAKLVEWPIFRDVYRNKVKKRWS
jgi:glycosyltransferase involved in cell wall biosynthesis